MKKTIMTLAAVLCCAMTTAVLTACTNDNIDTPVVTDLAEKIVGKWMLADMNGQPCPTNDKIVQTFLSATKVTESLSQTNYSDDTDKWHTSLEGTCSIEGSTVTMTFLPEDGVTTTCILNVQSITSTEMVASTKRTTIDNGRTVYEQEAKVRMVKVGADQSQAILGMWEGHVTSDKGSEFDDGEEHRWEYLADGSYVYYSKNAEGQFVPVESVFNQYFVDGTLLCTRWKNVGEGEEEHREWWEIAGIENGVMKWKALRQKEDGTTYIATFEMKKVDVPTQAEVEQFILGKWMISEINGEDAVTNLKTVYDFESLTKVYMSASLNSQPEMQSFWKEKFELTAVIDDNHIALAGQKDDKTAVLDEFIVSYITADVMQCVLLHSEINEAGEMTTAPYMFCTFKKVEQDYSQAIIGLWEGKATSEEGTYDDGEQHRWEYKADGTYVYYVKNGDEWVPSANTLNEYFVAGNLLCSRWINEGIEYREWWEVEIVENDVMKWKALRQRPDGTTYTATFQMTKNAE